VDPADPADRWSDCLPSESDMILYHTVCAVK
jgi:hypothetical protein